MTIFDFLVLFVLVCSIVISMMRGLLKEIFSLVSWVLAFVLANTYGEALARLLPESIPGYSTRLIVAFLALFVGIKFLMMLLTKVVEEIVKATGLTMADRGLGGLFGLARGLVIVMAAVLVCGMTAIPKQPFWRQALFSPMAETAARTAKPFLPNNFARHIQF